MKVTGRALVVVGWLLFLSALFLPAARVEIPEFLGLRVAIDERLTGWQAALAALKALASLAEEPDQTLFVLAGFGNLVFLLSPLTLARRSREVNRWLLSLLLISLGAAVALWFQVEGWSFFGIGYYAWLLALSCVATAMWLQSRRGRTRKTVEA
jgi:hypothetical protein